MAQGKVVQSALQGILRPLSRITLRTKPFLDCVKEIAQARRPMAPKPTVSLTGTHAAAIEGPKGETRIYYQADDGSLHERRGQGPAAFGNSYCTSRRILPAGVARMGTPLAVVTWGDTQAGKFNEVWLVSLRLAACDGQGSLFPEDPLLERAWLKLLLTVTVFYFLSKHQFRSACTTSQRLKTTCASSRVTTSARRGALASSTNASTVRRQARACSMLHASPALSTREAHGLAFRVRNIQRLSLRRVGSTAGMRRCCSDR